MERGWPIRFSQLQIREDNDVVDLSKSVAEQHYYPGLLQQSFTIGGLEVEQRLIFVGKRAAMISTKIKKSFS